MDYGICHRSVPPTQKKKNSGYPTDLNGARFRWLTLSTFDKIFSYRNARTMKNDLDSQDENFTGFVTWILVCRERLIKQNRRLTRRMFIRFFGFIHKHFNKTTQLYSYGNATQSRRNKEDFFHLGIFLFYNALSLGTTSRVYV